jgi:PHD/YefM family antitoxin component YafN of YafNO toxin-antitoxin module
MIQIRPVSDLRNKFPEIEKIIVGENKPVYFTKNGYGTMVAMSLEKYAELIDGNMAADRLPEWQVKK